MYKKIWHIEIGAHTWKKLDKKKSKFIIYTHEKPKIEHTFENLDTHKLKFIAYIQK
jgi:hypothetical protein